MKAVKIVFISLAVGLFVAALAGWIDIRRHPRCGPICRELRARKVHRDRVRRIIKRVDKLLPPAFQETIPKLRIHKGGAR